MIRRVMDGTNGKMDLDKLRGQNANSAYMASMWADKTEAVASVLDVVG